MIGLKNNTKASTGERLAYIPDKALSARNPKVIGY